MLITVFRSRLKQGLGDEYAAAVSRMSELARTMPGYISHKELLCGRWRTLHHRRVCARGRPAHLADQSRTFGRPENGAAKVLHRVQRAGLHAQPRVEIQATGGSGGADLTLGRENFISLAREL